MKRALLAVLALTVALIASALVTSGVSAHARYSDSTPGRGEVLETSPAEVSITFTQDVQRITGTYGIDVLDAGGSNWTAAPAEIDDTDRSLMTVQLQPDLPPGRYVVEYTNVSDEDGDPFAGAFSFYVAVEPTAEDLAADAELGQEEEEETPAPEASPTPPGATTPAASPTGAVPVDNGGDNATGIVLVLVIASIVAVVVLIVIGFAVLSRRSG